MVRLIPGPVLIHFSEQTDEGVSLTTKQTGRRGMDRPAGSPIRGDDDGLPDRGRPVG